ncbi:MAG: hypothetical protein A2521_00235 [Deltaproteobacteria bacterium RIFOXYD12_FULL_57_12]|nr:MAG: hypothetical protein A2521_00235 [Deltaproteobacteria bacterium RIFOXYD12_FULL_57_12]
MQIAVTITLTFLYFGLSLAFGGVRPGGFIWWFFAPCIVMVCAGFIASGIMAILPVPWTNGRRYGPPPRRVHLSWRAAVRLPVYAPPLLIPWHMLSILRMHFDLDWVLYLLVTLALAILAIVAQRRRREILLLRSGEVTLALVDYREVDIEWADRITYHFMTARGITVSGRGLYAGYENGVVEGSSIPVFYDADNPRDHVVACASWFEAD